jgi:hypothetical protein
MIRLMSSQLRALPIALALVAGASCWPAASFAQSAPEPASAIPAKPASTADAVRLTDEQRWEILDNNTEEKAAAARGELPGSRGVGRGIHGEVGVMIGSNGARGAYGTADIPLGENAGATVSFETSRFGYRRPQR